MTVATAKACAWLAARPWYVRILAPFLTGWLTVLAMPPLSLWPCLFVGLGVFYILLAHAATKRRKFWTGWLFGFGYFVFGLAWTAHALTVEGSTFSWVIPIAICGLPALLAVFFGLTALAAARLDTLRGFFGLAGLLALFEWLRGHVLTGFPWNLFAYGWAAQDAVALAMAQNASVFGAYGLTLITFLLATAAGFLVVWPGRTRDRIVFAATAAVVMAAMVGGGAYRLAAHPTQFDDAYTLRIVQPSISQTLKWDRAKTLSSFRATLRAAERNGDPLDPDAITLMIWPETAVEQDAMQDRVARSMLKRVFAGYPDRFYLATGVLRWETHGKKVRYFNSIGLYDKNLNLLETYDKAHLVPFGEYIPFSRFMPANPLVPVDDGLTPGDGPMAFAVPPSSRDPFLIAPMICYEVIFPGAIVLRDTHPHLLLNVTNDGWYGDSWGPYQHLQISRFRAIEQGVPMARAANTGVSAVIDAYGRILWRSKIFEVTAHNEKLPLTAARQTLYNRLGDMPFLLATALLCMVNFYRRRA